MALETNKPSLKEQAFDIIKKKHINVGMFQYCLRKGDYMFGDYEKYWNLWNFSPFANGTNADEKRLTKREWNILCEALL